MLVNNKTFLQKAGQISGLEWTVLGGVTKQGASQLGLITNPLEGGQVSAVASEIAAANTPNDRTMSKLISDRLRSWNPKNINVNDEEAFADALFDRLAHLRQVREGVFRNKGRVDTLMNYLTATGRKGAKGEWFGSYLTELVHAPGGASARSIADGDKIRVILQRTGIPSDLKLRYKEFIPEGVETAWELLVHAKQRMKGLSYTEGNPLWNDYASILRRSVEMAPGRRRTQAAIDALNKEIDFTGETLSIVQSSPSFPRFGVHGGRTEPEVDARTEHQLDARLYGRPRDVITGRGEGSKTGGVDLTHRGMDRWMPKRDEQSPTVESILAEGGIPGNRDIGDRTAFARNRVGRKKLDGPKTAQEIFDNSGMYTGKVVQYNGLPHRIEKIDPITNRATLTPISSDIELFATDALRRPASSLEAVKKIGARAGELPLAVDEVAKRAGREAKRVAEAIAARKTIGIRGGLLGAKNETVQVPMDLLREYLAGSSTFADREALKAAGFAGMADFAKRSDLYKKRFEAIVKTRLGTHRSLAGLTGQAAKDRLEELLQGGRVAIFEHLGGIQGGRSIQQLEEELINVAVRRGPKFALDQQNSVVAATFTELDRVVGGEVVESGFDRVARVQAKGVLGLGQDFTTNTGKRFFGKGRYVTTAEWQAGLEDFVSAIDRRRTAGQSAGQILRGAFDEGFGVIGATNPKRVPGIIDKTDQLVDLALNLRSDLAALGSRDPTVIRQKDALLNSLGLQEIRGTARLDRMLAQARESGDPIAAKAFLEAKALHVQGVQERRLRQNNVLTRDTALERIGTVEEGATNPLSQAINRDNESQFLDLFKAAADLPVEQHGQALRDLGVRTTLDGNRQAAVLTSRSGENLVLKGVLNPDFKENPTVPEFRGYAAVSQHDPLLARFMGGAEQPFEVHIGEMQRALEAGQFVVKNTTEAQIKAAALKTARENFVHTYLADPPAGLPVFKHGNSVVGFLESDLVNAQSVIENAKAAMEGKRALLFIDIETNRQVNQITNFAMRRLEKIDGVWQEVGESVQLATSELWGMGGVGGSAASRIAVRGGTRTLISQVMENEQALADEAAALLNKHLVNPKTGIKDAVIIGHNIGFDIGKLAKVQGLEESAASILVNAARNNVTDTLLLSQITHPGQTSQGLDALGRTIAGQMAPSAHLALPDVSRNIEVFKEIAKRSDVALAGLNALEQVKLNPDSVLWAHGGGGNIRDRAFKIAGILDTEAASDAFYKQTGKDLGVGFGVALQPLDFVTGMPTGPTQLHFAQTPHGWAKAFTGQFDILDPTAAAAKMEEKASDLARRRLRRITADENSFTNLLTERKRIAISDAAARGPEALSEMQDLLAHRLATTESEADRGLLRSAYRYSETFLQDSRVRRQLELEKGFMAEEVGRMHRPVVDWLEKALLDAPAGQLKSTKEHVNRVWNDYMAAINEAHPIAQIDTPAKTSIALQIDKLGKNPVALFARDEHTLRSSLQQKVLDIARKLQGSQELENLYVHSEQSEINRIGTLIRHGENFLDTDLGRTIESHIFDHHIAPALQEALVDLGEGAKAPLKVRAANIDEAVSHILSRTGELANQHKTTAADYLTSRTIPQESLAAIQQQIGVGGDLVSRAEALASAENLKVALHHKAPHSWTGKRFADLFETAATAGAEDQMQFTDRMRGIFKKLAAADQEVVAQIMHSKTPQWADEITGVKKAAEVIQASKPVRDFNPGALTNAGIEAGEAIAENAQGLKVAGLVGLGIIAIGIGMTARKPRNSPTQSGKDQDEQQYLHSTENEISKRKERVANQTPMVSKIAVTISGEDPNGIDHQELTQSVHGALGSFLGREIHRAANVNDNRSKIDRGYLDRLGAQLLKNPTQVR